MSQIPQRIMGVFFNSFYVLHNANKLSTILLKLILVNARNVFLGKPIFIRFEFCVMVVIF